MANSLYDLDSQAHSEVSSIVSASHPMMTQDPSEVVHNLSTTIVDEDHVIVKESLLMVEKLLKQGPSAKRYHGVLCSSMDMLHALVNATCRSFEILARGSKETHQALEDAVERAQKSTNILR